jgi:hypothetical protein
VAAADTVLFWCNERIRLLKNTAGDPQIKEALSWVGRVRREQREAQEKDVKP